MELKTALAIALSVFAVFTEITRADGDVSTKKKVKELKVPGKNQDGKIHMDIKGPLSPKIYSCEGKPDGFQLLPYPTDCLHFFACAKNQTYRIKCPVMNKQTFFNPDKGLCDEVVDENYCITHAGDHREELIEKSGISWEIDENPIDEMEEKVEEKEEEFTVVFDKQDEKDEKRKKEKEEL